MAGTPVSAHGYILERSPFRPEADMVQAFMDINRMPPEIERLQSAWEPIRQALGTKYGVSWLATHDGCAHVECLDGVYHYVVTERGSELERRMAANADEVMYWLAQDASFELACSHEVRHRVANQDCRRLLFAKQVELLASANPLWAARRMEEHRDILKAHPFRD